MNQLTELPNIGKVLQQQLCAIGLETPQMLREAGSKNAWLGIKRIDPSACYMRLCALQGAIEGVRWHDLSPQTRAELKEFYNEHKVVSA